MLNPGFGKVETITDGNFTAVKIDEAGLVYEDVNGSEVFELPKPSLQICSFLIENANEPFLPTEIKRLSLDYEGNVSKDFKGTVKGLGNTSLKNHFISLGRSSGTWYGFIDDDSMASKLSFAEVGLTKIEMDSMVYGHNRRFAARREKPFVAYKKYLSEGEKEPFFTRNKKIAGASALAITAGAITVYVTRHFKHS